MFLASRRERPKDSERFWPAWRRDDQRSQAMQLGVIFPQTEIGADPKAVRDFVQAAEGMGYAHLIVFDHVLGADVAHYPGWQGAYTQRDMFHEPVVLSGYPAAFRKRIEP